VVDLQGLFKSAILAFSSRGRRRVGFDGGRECSSMFLNEQLPAYDPDRHAVLRYLDVADYLGAPTEDTPKLDFPRHDRAAEEAERLLAGLASPRVVVNPGAKWVTKLWPAGHWQRLCGLLTEKAGLQVLLTGGPDEQAINARIGAGLTGLIDLTGRTRLKVLAEVMRAADLVICPDTGPMHLAAAVGTPVTALFGPTAPWRTGPFGPGHVVLRLESGCGPCFKKQCPDPHCMTGLTPETVFDKALDRLEKGRI
ncbi:MAG: glycosyltransferase family 9 protein, partial [Proteobacteria bacterium]|nr:glycosyltransferase family 9 protein [Pseudomonadota bacterium]